ncbi:tetratricopeptide repeat protein [Nonomuraea sp. PA05]|uniref:AfsR/SARP family transcriptional regulator n=1 Tax=Nonomuraea sp. PA05 TaxID=2604466 RepID=UPI0011D66E2B|nr:BTAD domain-containing putative transcriptional regulator [Nonomuraea sp. PA05]TYB52730.1 tetratricopeptide repeat protein [Nonomuraea sp. PA05]
MRFGVLGPLTVWTEAGDPVRVPEAKVRALLADLLIQEGHPVSADRLVDDLWEEDLPRHPANALQQKVSQLRRVLNDAEPGARDLVGFGPAGYRLMVEADAVDQGRFAVLVSRARGAADPRSKASLLADALALWRGPALADFAGAAFAGLAIARLEEARLDALEERAEARLELGEHRVLAGELGALAARHPLRERMQAAYLRALYGAGRQAEALEAYEQVRRLLADELGADPGPRLAALHAAMLRQDPALTPRPAGRQDSTASPASATSGRQDPAASATSGRQDPAASATSGLSGRQDPAASQSSGLSGGTVPRTSPTSALSGGFASGLLPVPATTLIGRDEEARRVRAALERSRLITLTGPGGVGKTRLALEVAAAWDEDDGVHPVELAESRRFDADVVLEALGVRDDGRPRVLHEVLRDRRLLLVLDNCEHVLDQVAEVLGPLLPRVPGLRVLATSREPLRLSGETVVAVPPLEPEAAVRLFAERAAASGAVVDDDEAVAGICRRLGGIPLAVELAASRVRGLGVRELAGRLSLRLLSGGPRDAPARQRTLTAVIDWSWELLGRPERVVLARLAVHSGGCTLEAAERTCAGDGVDVSEIMDVLARLVDRSMVVRNDGRYRLLEPIAEYCLERLADAGELEIMRGRHSDYYAALAVRAEPGLRGAEQDMWLTRLRAEAANLRAALDSAVEDGVVDRALALVNAQTWYWFMTGRLSEARHALTRALSPAGGEPAVRAQALAWSRVIGIRSGETQPEGITGPEGIIGREGITGPELGSGAEQALEGVADPVTRARLRWLVGFAMIGVGGQADGVRQLEEALRASEAAGDRWGVAAALAGLARYAALRGDFDAVRRDGERAAVLFGELGDQWGLLQTAEPLGVLAEVGGAYAEAARHFTTGLRVAERLGLWSQVSLLASRLGRIALLTGDLVRADELHERARGLATERSDKSMEEFARIGLGLAARRRGDLDAAEGYFRTGLEWLRRIGGGGAPMALLLAELGFVAELRGDAPTAAGLHARSLEVARADGDDRAEALALEGLAGVRVLEGDPDEAARLLRTARELRERAGAPLPAAERSDVDRIGAVISGESLSGR